MSIPDDFTCPECGSPLDFFDCGMERVGGRTYNWESWVCKKCGEKFSNEPDWDEFRT